MKRRMNNSIAVALILLLSVTAFAPIGQGQPLGRRFRSDTGIMTPGAGQILRITVIIDVDFGPTNVRFG